MTSVLSQSWFVWALIIVLALPVALVVLTEIQARLARRGSPAARPVAILRNYVLPSGALVILLTKATQISAQDTWVRIVATFFGFVLMLLLLSTMNVALFSNAAAGTWRERMPSIFVDIFRLVLIVTGLALIFAYIWDADVAGLFTALGVTSVVLGFALQNAVGSTVSGLLLLFEQPFRIGDWLNTGAVRGRIVEVNWRAVHIDIGSGIQIVPNAALASSSFANLSRPTEEHVEEVTTTFALDDPPGAVIALLDRVAADLPMVDRGHLPTTTMKAPKTYVTAIPLAGPWLAGAASSTLQRWTWYAARREGLQLDGIADDYATPQRVEAALRGLAPVLHLDEREIEALAPSVTLERFGAGETVQAPDVVPMAMRFVVQGRIVLRTRTSDGGLLKVGDLDTNDYVGQTTLTREPARAGGWAADDVTVLKIPRDVVDELVRTRPQLTRDIGRGIEQRRQRIREALERAGASAPHTPTRVGAQRGLLRKATSR